MLLTSLQMMRMMMTIGKEVMFGWMTWSVVASLMGCGLGVEPSRRAVSWTKSKEVW